jgi:hypothetical protein
METPVAVLKVLEAVVVVTTVALVVVVVVVVVVVLTHWKHMSICK